MIPKRCCLAFWNTSFNCDPLKNMVFPPWGLIFKSSLHIIIHMAAQSREIFVDHTRYYGEHLSCFAVLCWASKKCHRKLQIGALKLQMPKHIYIQDSNCFLT
jgi:hypothetical protein